MPKAFAVAAGAEIVIGNLGTATTTVGVEVSEKVARMLGPDLRVEREPIEAAARETRFGDTSFRRGPRR
jgi:hypothetical protein